MKASGPEFDLLNAKLEVKSNRVGRCHQLLTTLVRVQAVLSETRAQQTDTLNEIVFRGENIPVKHDAVSYVV